MALFSSTREPKNALDGVGAFVNLVFDVGNVLLRWDPVALVRSLLPGADPERAVSSLFGATHWPALDAGTIRFEDAVSAGAGGSGLGPEEVADFYARIPAQLEPIGEIVDRLGGLAERADTRLFVLSNMPDYMRNELIERHDFFRLFEHCLFSCDVRCNKPDAAIYGALLGGHDLVPADTLFIDDRRENLDAAQTFGMATLQLPVGAGRTVRERVSQQILSWRPPAREAGSGS